MPFRQKKSTQLKLSNLFHKNNRGNDELWSKILGNCENFDEAPKVLYRLRINNKNLLRIQAQNKHIAPKNKQNNPALANCQLITLSFIFDNFQLEIIYSIENLSLQPMGLAYCDQLHTLDLVEICIFN